MAVSSTSIKIILADDHEIFRDGFQTLLKNQTAIEMIAEAADGEQLVRLVSLHEPDVVLTDIEMPVMDGIEATRLISRTHPGIGIIALTMFNNDKMIINMIEAGATGYLLKNANKKEIIEAINSVAKHKPYYCTATDIKLAQMITNSRFIPNQPHQQLKFTDKEKEIMCLICREFSNKEISEQLYLSVRTIESHRERILFKTGARNTAGLVVYAIQSGIYKHRE